MAQQFTASLTQMLSHFEPLQQPSCLPYPNTRHLLRLSPDGQKLGYHRFCIEVGQECLKVEGCQVFFIDSKQQKTLLFDIEETCLLEQLLYLKHFITPENATALRDYQKVLDDIVAMRTCLPNQDDNATARLNVWADSAIQ